jgi:hypothetical protein
VSESLLVNCTLENDLVDYFKTFKQGVLEIKIGDLNLVGRAVITQSLRQRRPKTELLYEIDLFNLNLRVATISILVKITGEFVNQQIIERSNQHHQESKHVYSREAGSVAEHSKSQRVAAFKLRHKDIIQMSPTKDLIRTYSETDLGQPKVEFIGVPKPGNISVDVR